MDIKQSLTYRSDELKQFEFVGNNKYDYAKNGILRHCLPKILFAGNPILVSFIQLIDMRLIMMFKYIDKIKQFKNIAKY